MNRSMETNKYIGLTYDEVRALMKTKKADWRVTREDDTSYMVTDDFRLDRYNFEFDKGICTKASMG